MPRFSGAHIQINFGNHSHVAVVFGVAGQVERLVYELVIDVELEGLLDFAIAGKLGETFDVVRDISYVSFRGVVEQGQEG